MKPIWKWKHLSNTLSPQVTTIMGVRKFNVKWGIAWLHPLQPFMATVVEWILWSLNWIWLSPLASLVGIRLGKSHIVFTWLQDAATVVKASQLPSAQIVIAWHTGGCATVNFEARLWQITFSKAIITSNCHQTIINQGLPISWMCCFFVVVVVVSWALINSGLFSTVESKYAGGNPVCVRPTPSWQKGIGEFFGQTPNRREKENHNSEEEPGCSEIGKRRKK